jgi:hypothetical protein
MRKKTILSSLILLFTCFSLSIQAAVVHLKDGSQLRGTVVSATARDVQLHTEHGVLKIDAEKILRIDYAETGAPSVAPAATPPPAETPPVPSHDRASYNVQVDPGPMNQSFWFDLGMISPLSRLDPAGTGGIPARNGGTGFRLGGDYLYSLSPQLATGLGFHYFHRGTVDDFGLIPTGQATITGDTIMPLALLKYTFTRRGAARPFVLAGLGANHTSTEVDAQPLEGFAWSDTGTWENRRLVDDSKWGLASRAAVGIDFHHADLSVIGFQIGWMGIHNRRYQGTLAGKDLGLDSVKGDLNALDVSLRWGWKF